MEKNDEKLVFVTGASRGIGKATAEWFKERGYCVAHGFFSNMEMSLKPLKDDNNLSVRLNIRNRSSIKKAIKWSRIILKKISILVNNAAIAQEKAFLTISDKDFDLMLQTNLKGPFIFVRKSYPIWLRLIGDALSISPRLEANGAV